MTTVLLATLLVLVMAAQAWANGVEIYTMTQVGWRVICLAELAILAVETVALKFMLKLRPGEAFATALMANVASFLFVGLFSMATSNVVIDWFLNGREWNSTYAGVVMEQLGRHWLDEWLSAEPYTLGNYRLNWFAQLLAFAATLGIELAVLRWFLRDRCSTARLARTCILLNGCTYSGLTVLIYYYTLNMTPVFY